MPLPQSKNRVGLGHAIINRRAKEARDPKSSEFHTTDTHFGQPKWKQLQSVTHEGDLEEFLNTAEMADADFTAERRGVKVIDTSGSRTRHNPYLLTPQQEAEVLENQRANKDRLRVPRRPRWNERTTPAQLERAEKDAFLTWRRGLAELQDGIGFVLTPFERNLEVWRQLWRVIERSQLVVQIVDARNPLRFRCEDLERYVHSMPANPADMSAIPPDDAKHYRGPRNTLLLINKADLLDNEQRRLWAKHFQDHGVMFAFFSAMDETARQLAKQQRAEQFEAVRIQKDSENVEHEEKQGIEGTDNTSDDDQSQAPHHTESVKDADTANTTPDVKSLDDSRTPEATADAVESTLSLQDDPARILSVLELEDLFLHCAPDLTLFRRPGTDLPNDGVPEKLTVGFVGYPNVGKSSTINALLGEKKVSVSATPGKTKHFQTIHLSPTTIICDCPGLVFPQFSTSPADLVCDGILPIDQMREYTAPAELVAQRIPKDILCRTYNMDIPTLSKEEGGLGRPTGMEILTAFAIARGLSRQGQGNPDESRAARYVLKDYVNARLLYAHPPPGVDAHTFNAGRQEKLRQELPERRPASTPSSSSSSTTPVTPHMHGGRASVADSSKTASIDQAFFGDSATSSIMTKGRRRMPPVGRLSMEQTGAPGLGSKKHNKGNKRRKQRSAQD